MLQPTLHNHQTVQTASFQFRPLKYLTNMTNQTPRGCSARPPSLSRTSGGMRRSLRHTVRASGFGEPQLRGSNKVPTNESSNTMEPTCCPPVILTHRMDAFLESGHLQPPTAAAVGWDLPDSKGGGSGSRGGLGETAKAVKARDWPREWRNVGHRSHAVVQSRVGIPLWG